MTKALSLEEQKLTYALFCHQHINMNGSLDDFLQKTHNEMQIFIGKKETEQVIGQINIDSLINAEVFPLGVTFLYNGNSPRRGDYYSFFKNKFGSFFYSAMIKDEAIFRMWRNNLLINLNEQEKYRRYTAQLDSQYIKNLLEAYDSKFSSNTPVLEYV